MTVDPIGCWDPSLACFGAGGGAESSCFKVFSLLTSEAGASSSEFSVPVTNSVTNLENGPPLVMSSAYDPHSLILPSAIVIIWSTFGSNRREWVIRIRVFELRVFLSTFSNTVSETWGSKAEKESSRNVMSQLWYKARAMLMRCFWPPERETPFSQTSVRSPFLARSSKCVTLATEGQRTHRKTLKSGRRQQSRTTDW